jgi:hypothetical protein
MAQVIIMANKYGKRPSEMLGIDNDYLAYCFDEAALFLESQATDDKGGINWNRIRWKGEGKKESNKGLIEFIKKHNSKHR